MQVVEIPVESTNKTDSNDVHYFCWCNPDKGLCGKDVSDHQFIWYDDSRDPVSCIVCVDMAYYACPLCGEDPCEG